MYQLLQLFFELCLFRKKPQDIPASVGLLRLLTLLYAVISCLMLMFSSNLFVAVPQVVVETLLILGLAWIILFIARRPARYLQTASALIGTDALISFLALPAMATLIGQGSGLAFIAIVLFMLWHWVVSGHIFSQALEQPFIFGLGIAFLYILVSYQVVILLFAEVIVIE